MRRLAVIDVATGDQPLYNEDQSLALVVNGEIYNYREIRADLITRGHVFRTGSDCEVILHLYEEMGEACLQRLRGMFAFALYDSKQRRVLLARDRMGEKPLYYCLRGGRIYFASEAKALVKAGVLPFRIHAESVLRYLFWGFVPGTMSAIEGVVRLDAAHLLTIDVDTLEMRSQCYWDPRAASPVDRDPVSSLRCELERVGELVVRSDVPVGICLSAGLDSSAIAALAARNRPGDITGVTVGFAGNPRQDEREEARHFARYLKIDHIELELTPRDAARGLHAVCAASDEPLNDSAGSSIYWMMQRCRAEGLKVMLTGLGGDELFWGYGWLQTALKNSQRKRCALEGRARIADYLAVGAPPRSYTQLLRWMSDCGGLRSGARALSQDRLHPLQLVFWDLTQSFGDASNSLSHLLEPSWLSGVDQRSPFRPFTVEAWPARLDQELMCLLFETYLRENGLAQSDRLSSVHSVEMRTPLVDHKFVELVLGLQLSSPNAVTKATFAKVLEGLVPAWVAKRRKRGFSSPWRAWSREIGARYGLLLVDGVLVQERILRAEQAARISAHLVSGRFGGHHPLAHAMMRLELWARGFRDLAGRQWDLDEVEAPMRALV